MSTPDHLGLRARLDRWGSPEGPRQEPSSRVARLGWRRALGVVALLGVLAAWTRDGEAEPITVLEPIAVPAPEARPFSTHSHPIVDRWTESFRTSRKAEFERLMRRRALYADLIRTELNERGLPEELLYIPVIESGMSPFAVSRVSAVGLWQFMSPTALQYGLRVDAYVDERRDPVRATRAALDYIEWLHDRFDNSWYLAMAAFNAGPGRVERLVNLHAGGRMSDDVYWEIWSYLPRETRGYVPKMVAIARLGAQVDSEAFGDAEVFLPYRYDNVFVPGNTTLRAVARALDVDVEVLRDLNPHLVRGVTPPGEMFGLRIPVGGAEAVVAALADGPPSRRGDRLSESA